MLFTTDPTTTDFLDSLLLGALSKAFQKGGRVTGTSFTSGMSSLRSYWRESSGGLQG